MAFPVLVALHSALTHTFDDGRYVSNITLIFNYFMLLYYQSWMFYIHFNFISFFGTNPLT